MFIDTNILIYRSIDSSPFHQPAISAMKKAEELGARFTLSRQVLREYLSATTRIVNKPAMISLTQALKDVQVFAERFAVLDAGPEVWTEFEVLLSEGGFAGKQVHDAHHVAIMLAHGEKQLLTNNAADFLRFDSKIEIVSI
jgi:predicted nucleic acid-binding protein